MSLATANAFAALQKTSKKDKKKEEKKKSKDKKKADKAAEALEQAIFSQPSISVSNWADCDTDDDDGFHAAPLPSFEGVSPTDAHVPHPNPPPPPLSLFRCPAHTFACETGGTKKPATVAKAV